MEREVGLISAVNGKDLAEFVNCRRLVFSIVGGSNKFCGCDLSTGRVGPERHYLLTMGVPGRQDDDARRMHFRAIT